MSRHSFDKEFNIHSNILYHWIQRYVKYGGRAFPCKRKRSFLQHVKLKINFKIVEQKYVWFNKNV